LLRKYKLAGQDNNQVCQQETQKRVEPSGTRLLVEREMLTRMPNDARIDVLL
jgi:hypothetical protein